MSDNVDARPRPTLLLTRPRASSNRFATEIADQGLDLSIVVSPLMDIVPTGPAPTIDRDSSLIFTSSHAVRFAGAGNGRKAWCVGRRVTETAQNAGFDAMLAGGCADALVALILSRPDVGPLVHLRGTHQRGDIAERLTAGGMHVTSHIVYDQIALAPGQAFFDALASTPLIVPLFSPRSARLFSTAADSWKPRPNDVLLALSRAVVDELPRNWAANVKITERPDGRALRDAVVRSIFP